MSTVQYDLFGDPINIAPASEAGEVNRAAKKRLQTVDAKSQQSVQAAIQSDDLGNLATKLAINTYLGTSSWSFTGWQHLVYDGQYPETTLSRTGLGAYAAHPLFRSVGIDRTFYSPIGEDVFRRYAKQARGVNKDFRFLTKAPMLFTGPRLRSDSGQWSDNAAFLNAALATAQFVLPATHGLEDACGPLVFQFPPLGPRFTRAPERFADALAEFLLALPKLSLPACYAVEIRDPELLTQDYLAALNAANATHCIAIHARMPDALTQAHYWREANRHLPLVIRWSLHSGFKYEEAKERYAPFNAIVDQDDNGLEHVCTLIDEAQCASRASFTIVNNKAEGCAPKTVLRIAQWLCDNGSHAPIVSTPR